jgi:hypothetical protein
MEVFLSVHPVNMTIAAALSPDTRRSLSGRTATIPEIRLATQSPPNSKTLLH